MPLLNTNAGWEASRPHRLLEGNTMSDQVAAAHILLMYAGSERSTAPRSKDEAQQQIDEIRQEVDGGADFGLLAQKHSDCPSGKDGGSLGSFGRGQTPTWCEPRGVPAWLRGWSCGARWGSACASAVCVGGALVRRGEAEGGPSLPPELWPATRRGYSRGPGLGSNGRGPRRW